MFGFPLVPVAPDTKEKPAPAKPARVPKINNIASGRRLA
ncbi:hypothetical protein CEV33_1631 [Brucella grignonensis]|uniref:Uncharacterized protein n=1 Tax=Brucella grignonensis TaxID=94627 RepID=A0A256FB21_9HYPH|nr:hypothetical protein CEV33_1631 [Brucella grignonensis]